MQRNQIIKIAFINLFFATILLAQSASEIIHTPHEQAEILNLGSNINSTFTEFTPFITPDEKILFFESDRPGGIGETGSFDLWYSINSANDRKIPAFSLPTNLGAPVNTTGFDGLPSLRKTSENTYELYFSSFAGNGRNGPLESNIYYSRQIGNEWSTPILVPGINSDFHDRMPSISPDGKYLFFSSDRPGGFGKDDIWMSQYDDVNKRWKDPVNLGETINTSASEISPSIHADGITLYFSSDKIGGVGGYDIYVTQRLSAGNWKHPVNMGTPYNTEQDDEYPTVLSSGEFMYFTSNRPGGFGGYDIYRARVPDFAKPTVVVTLNGRVFEMDTKKGIEATITVRGDERRFDISSGLPDGNFKTDFINNKIYQIMITAPGYEPFKYTLDLRTSHESKIISMDFPMKKINHSINSYNIVLQFIDKDGQNVEARSIYQFSPDDKEMKKMDKNSIVLNVPKSITSWNSFLERNTLNIIAEADGFEDKNYSVSMLSLMDRGKHDSNTIIIPIEMSRTGVNQSDAGVDLNNFKGNLTLLNTIYFELDVANKITENEIQKLTVIVEALKKSDIIIEIHGHTDRQGGLQKNVKLSNDRADFIKNLLVQKGIPAERMITFGHNYSRPAVKEVNEATRKKNRRVEIFIKKKQNNNME
ncbi:MAG: OmpA family protein [Spirochaetia bacterium]|nr:OmpA family protein [Spirochaetia bacterium]